MPDEIEDVESPSSNSAKPSGWLTGLAVAVLGIGAAGAGFGYQQQQKVTQLAAHEQEMSAEMTKLRQQVDALTATVTAPPPAAAQIAPAAAPGKQGGATRPARRSTEDRRIRQLQAKVTEQEKQLQETREAMERNRLDIDGRLNSTRDELGGSIARTHDELALLKKQGENDYVEFDALKSKAFQRVGPVSVSLRKADVKRKTYDLVMVVDDNQLTKKKVNLYEPIWIHRNDDPQPVQIVVFRVEKNRVHGYVRSPRYRQSELKVAAVPAPPEP